MIFYSPAKSLLSLFLPFLEDFTVDKMIIDTKMRPFFTQKTSAMALENQCFSPNNSQKNDWEIGQPPSIIDLIFFFKAFALLFFNGFSPAGPFFPFGNLCNQGNCHVLVCSTVADGTIRYDTKLH